MENTTIQNDEMVMEQGQTEIMNMSIADASQIAQEYLGYIAEDRIGHMDYGKELEKLVSSIAGSTSFDGDADDFHNFAVTLARGNKYSMACRILEYGLKQFPYNVDLLADFLEYGKQCEQSKTKKLDKYYRALLSIPKVRWTWRGFAFSIDYLLYLNEQNNGKDSEKDILNRESEMLSIVEEYRKYYPYESKIYLDLKRFDDELKILKNAMGLLKICPRCCLRYAEIMMNRIFDYPEALHAIQRGIKEVNQSQARINFGYLYYTSALCKMAKFHQDEKNFEEAEILDIYCDFNIALSELGEKQEYRDIIISKTRILVNKTLIEIPNDYDKLIECLDD